MRPTITYRCEQCSETVTKEQRGGNSIRGRFCSIPCFRLSIKVDSTPTSAGYLVRTVPGQRQGYVHRQVMAEKLGRALLPGETVHHINGDRADNRPENLEIWHKAQVPGQRLHEKLLASTQLLAQYGMSMPFVAGVGDGLLYL